MAESHMLGDVNLANVANCERDGGTKLTASIQQIMDSEDVRGYIGHIDFTLLKEKLIKGVDDGGQGWTIEVADKGELKYKRWLFLKWKYPNELIPPPNDIDLLWHGHILDSQAYHRDTAAVFGQYLHHYPYFGLRGKADHAKLLEAFENTKRLYRDEYGEEVTD